MFLMKSPRDDQHHYHQNDPTTQNLEEFLCRLEEEHVKIDAFKRELPLCMQLLTNAMEASRQQLQSLRANHGIEPRPIVLEEFIPLKNSISGGGTDQKAVAASDKANWMTTAQLWSQGNNNEESMHKKHHTPNNNNETELGFSIFSSSLALASPGNEGMREEKKGSILEFDSGCGGDSSGVALPQPQDSEITTTTTTATQPQRKARRCWSPELHRRFVNALHMLGGSNVATPKQIRELMKVDGLTNDEVKSHLQKYRLHTRRPGPSPQAAAAAAPQLVVLGGIWVPPEYAAHGGAQTATLYSAAHPTAQHFSMGGHEFYAAAPTPPPATSQHLPFHHHAGHQFHVYKPQPPSLSQAHNSMESDPRGTGNRSESIEVGKSESGSWKADSGGGNGGERKGVALKEDGEVSNGSDITLKF